ncbi:MAG: hypothetical protein FWD47_05215 [Treponema sp.]|nr:hypothetical protein [Treponema sp.]
MKRYFLVCLLFVLFAASGVFAQEDRAPNTVLGGINIGFLTFGADVEFERTFPGLLPMGTLAASIEAGYTTVLIFPIFNADVRARWYPWSNMFYADIGFGYGSLFYGFGTASAFIISPGVGWRIDIGQPNAWVFVPSIQFNYFAGSKSNDDFGGTLIKLNARIGYSF